MENNSIIPAVHQNMFKEVGPLKDGDRIVLIPQDHVLRNLDEAFRKKKSSKVHCDSLDSLAQYAESFSSENAICFVSKGDVQVVLDYHTADEIGDCRHSAFYSATRNPVWTSVKSSIGSRFSQREFANHWRDFKDIVIKPKQADLLNQLQKIKVMKKVDQDYEVSSNNRRTTSDASVNYSDIPEEISVLVKPYVELKDAFETTCRISIHDDSSLQLSYRMPRLEEAIQKADKAFFKLVKDAFTSAGIKCPVLQGSLAPGKKFEKDDDLPF